MTLVVPFPELVLRLIAAMIAGMLIGLERESHGRAAGMRTTMLVCVAAALAMLISDSLFAEVASEVGVTTRPDPARLAQGVLSGMGFLGAGAIIRNGNRVQGVTTAATLWYVTMMGLAIGAGLYWLGALATALAVIVLFFMPRLEKAVKEDWYAIVNVTIVLDGASEDELKNKLESQGVKVKQADIDYDLHTGVRHIAYEVKFKRSGLFDLSTRVVKAVSEVPGVKRVRWT